MSTTIHPTAIVDAKAQLGEGVRVGPYSIVGAGVTLGDRVTLISHAVVEGLTEIGAETEIFPFASIGHRPQDKKFKGEDSRLIIGKRNVIREHVTMNPGTEGGGMVTRVGDDGLFMASSHVAHDCIVGNGVILANNATLAGHVTVEDYVIIGGLSAIHQFVCLGEGSMVGGMVGVTKDVIPFGMAAGARGELNGLNLIGLKRRKLAREQIHQIRRLYQSLFYGEGTLTDRARALQSDTLCPEAQQILRFVLRDSARAFSVPFTEMTEDA